MKRPLIAVFGSSTLRRTDPEYTTAHELGRRLAEAGADLMTGGYGGAMEACSRGCHEAGGHVIGITVEMFESRGGPNQWVKERVHTSDLFDRLRHLVSRADGFIAVPGSVGTLTEVLFTWTMLSSGGRRPAPLVLLGAPWQEYLGAHRRADLVHPEQFEFVSTARTVDDATRLVLEGVSAAR